MPAPTQHIALAGTPDDGSSCRLAMPRCKNHWMPWYVAVPLALFLFLLAPFFRKWVDVVLWPKIANWWASRSRLTLQKRILKLEATLTRVEALPTLGEFEDLVLRSINGIVALLVIIPLLAAMAYVIAFCDPAFSLIPKDWYRQLLLLLLAFVHCLTGVGMLRFVDRFRLERSTEYKTALRNDLRTLQVQVL